MWLACDGMEVRFLLEQWHKDGLLIKELFLVGKLSPVKFEMYDLQVKMFFQDINFRQFWDKLQ